MKNRANSINKNGCSVCATGKERYTTFRLVYRPSKRYFQYDYRHSDGELFSAVTSTLKLSREMRDKWVQAKNYKRLFPNVLKKIQEKRRLTKSEMAYQIGHIEPLNTVAISWDYFKREDIVSTFNQIFGTEIK
jgi:hypothetical protein